MIFIYELFKEASDASITSRILCWIISGQVNVLVFRRHSSFNISDIDVILTAFHNDMVECIDCFNCIIQTTSVSKTNGLLSHCGHFWPVMDGKFRTCQFIVTTNCSYFVIIGNFQDAQIIKDTVTSYIKMFLIFSI